MTLSKNTHEILDLQGAPSYSPSVGERAGSEEAHSHSGLRRKVGLMPILSRFRKVHSDSISTGASSPVAQ